MYQASGKLIKAGVAILISGKIHFKKKSIAMDKEGIHNDKRVSSSERRNSHKCMCA